MSRELVATHDEVIHFLLKHDFIFFEDVDDDSVHEEWASGPSNQDFQELKECLFRFYRDSQKEHVRSTNDQLIDGDGRKWRFRVRCTPDFIDVKLRMIPPTDDPKLEYSVEVKFDFVSARCRVSERMNRLQMRKPSGLMGGLVAKFEHRQREKMNAEHSGERQEFLDEVVSTFLAERIRDREDAKRSGHRLTRGADLPAERSAPPQLSNRSVRTVFATSMCRPSAVPRAADVLVRKQVVYFEQGKHQSRLGEFEILVLETGHGVLARVIEEKTQTEWHAVQSWGPLGYSGDTQLELQEVQPKKFESQKLSCQYRAKSGETRELDLRTGWHYCEWSSWVDLESRSGASVAKGWIVFPFDDDDWQLIKFSLDLQPLPDLADPH